MNVVSLTRRLLRTLFVLLLGGLLVAVSLINRSQTSVDSVKLPTSVLFQLRDDAGLAVVNAVITNDNTDWLSLPARLQVGDRMLGELAVGLDVSAATRGIRNEVGFDIAQTWQIDRLGLAALIDNVDGVEVKAARNLTLTASNGESISLMAGYNYKLDAKFGSTYATDCEPRECVRRFNQVWRSLMERLDSAWLPEILESVGSSSRSTLNQLELVSLIERMQQRNAQQPTRILHLASKRAATLQGARWLTAAARKRLLEAGVAQSVR